MTHFIVLIIVPYNIFVKGLQEVKFYISGKLQPYSENLQVEPYVIIDKDKLKKDFDEFKTSDGKYQYQSIKEYCEDYLGYEIDQDGNASSTYNKDSLYDWYEIGGRWDGLFTDNKYEEDELKNNSISVNNLLDIYKKDKKTFSTIIDLDGNVHKDREMGWFGCYNKNIDDDKWEDVYVNILEHHKDDYVVNLDCHI